MLNIVIDLEQQGFHLFQIRHDGFVVEEKQHIMVLRNIDKTNALFQRETGMVINEIDIRLSGVCFRNRQGIG